MDLDFHRRLLPFKLTNQQLADYLYLVQLPRIADLRIDWLKLPVALISAYLAYLLFGMFFMRTRALPDDFMAMSLTTGLAPFFTKNVGVLNATAEATAFIDVSMLGKAVNGLVFYLLPAVLDPRAPFGIFVIGDPRPLVIEGL